MVIAVRQLARDGDREAGAQLRVLRHDGQVELALDELELKLEVPEPWADTSGDLPAEAPGTEQATGKYAQETAQGKD
jgi:hypothetical protein